MTTHIMSFTYEPKIEAVKSGECRQTTRIDTNVKEGDYILFHGWSGRPYRSKWSWRQKVRVKEVIPVRFTHHYFQYGSRAERKVEFGYGETWMDLKMAAIYAQRDFIDPGVEIPTDRELGLAYRDVLYSLNNLQLREPADFDKVHEGQIIVWEPCRGDKE